MMDLGELRRNWNAMGEEDPLWAVLSDPAKLGGGWDLDDFLATGRSHIDSLLDRLVALGLAVSKDSALDFGCGVGRLTFALSTSFRRCVGVDIAPSMIDFANRINGPFGNCEFLLGRGDDLSYLLDSSFDFVLSYIVLQHMPPQFSMKYLEEFTRVLRPGGILAFQVPAQTEHIPTANALTPRAFQAAIDVREVPAVVVPGAVLLIQVDVANRSPVEWPVTAENQIKVGNHWYNAAGETIRHDDGRTALPAPLAPGEHVVLPLDCIAPADPGTYVLEIDLVQEGVAWFAQHGSGTRRIDVIVDAAFVPSGEVNCVEPSTLPPRMEMFCVPIPQIVGVLHAHGMVIESIRRDVSAGEGWRSYEYIATKR
jgi:SAM-dependent methyltransferase